jgi:hypothetical protein
VAVAAAPSGRAAGTSDGGRRGGDSRRGSGKCGHCAGGARVDCELGADLAAERRVKRSGGQSAAVGLDVYPGDTVGVGGKNYAGWIGIVAMAVDPIVGSHARAQVIMNMVFAANAGLGMTLDKWFTHLYHIWHGWRYPKAGIADSTRKISPMKST